MTDKKPKILERVLEHCGRSTRMPLGFLGVGEDVWQSPPDSVEVVASLTEEFALEELATSGVVVVNEDNSLTLTAALTGGAQFVALRDANTGEPYELLTSGGCVSPGALPVFVILRDVYTQQCLKQGGGALFLAFDIDEVVMLRDCGLPATLASGLEHLPLDDVDQFCKTFGVSRVRKHSVLSHEVSNFSNRNQPEGNPIDPFRHVAQMGTAERVAESDNKSDDPIQLIFLGWTLSNLSNTVPCQLGVVVDYFRQLNRFMGIDLYDVHIWEAEDEAIERLRFIAERRSAALFREAILEAADDAGADMMGFGRNRAKLLDRPSDYLTALARLQDSTSSDVRSHPMGPSQRKRVWNEVRHFLGQQVINPIREYALESGDPIERNVLMGIAELSQVLHMQTTLIGEQLSRQISEPGVERAEPLPDNRFKNLLATADRLINMTKALGLCSQPRTKFIQSRTIDARSIPRLPRSE